MTLPTPTKRQYRYIVMFEPDRPRHPSEYMREVVIDSLYPGDAIRAALDALGTDSDGRDITFWQAERVLVSVRRTA